MSHSTVLVPTPPTAAHITAPHTTAPPTTAPPTTAPAPRGTDRAPRYVLLLSTDADEVAAAQRLRHDVFATELGANLVEARDGRDIDRFDAFCDHLLVREEDSGTIVGCYRMLPPHAARAAGGLYTETEFDITALAPQRHQLVETGRSCVHPDHRTGAVMSLMWSGILRYLVLTGNRWVLGCASVPFGNGETRGSYAAGVRRLVLAGGLAPEHHRVHPLHPVVLDGVALADVPVPPRPALPPLLKGYLRLGATVCGEPALDTDFGVADFAVLLGLDDIDPRYVRRLVGPHQ